MQSGVCRTIQIQTKTIKTTLIAQKGDLHYEESDTHLTISQVWEDRTFTFIQRLHYFYLYLDIIHSTYNKKLKLILIKSCQLGFSRKNSIPPIEDTPFLSHRPPGYPRIIFVPDPLDIRYPQQGVQTFSGKAIAIPNKFPAGT